MEEMGWENQKLRGSREEKRREGTKNRTARKEDTHKKVTRRIMTGNKKK